MGTIYKRGNRYRATVRSKFHRSASRTFESKNEALAWVREREEEMAASQPATDGIAAVFSNQAKIVTGKTARDAFSRYAQEDSPKKKGARWEQIRLRKISRSPMSDILLTNITMDDIQGWIDENIAATSPDSANRELALVSSVFKKARYQWKWMRHNPIEGVERPREGKGRDRRISDDEITDVLSALRFDPDEVKRGPRWFIAVAFQLAIETAMRRGEIWGLDWADVDLQGRFVTLHETKNGTSRFVPLSKKAIRLFELIGPEEKGVIFKARVESAEAIFRKNMRDAGIENLRFHDTRHEATSRLKKIYDQLTLSRVTGHQDMKSLRRYFNPTGEELAEQMDETGLKGLQSSLRECKEKIEGLIRDGNFPSTTSRGEVVTEIIARMHEDLVTLVALNTD